MRESILKEVRSISPIDAEEEQTQADVIKWIESGVELCRTIKPATPPKHLISYFVVVDYPYVLLVDHINARLWLPTGGHVEPEEHPKDTVVREAREELGIESVFLFENPIFVTSTTTVGLTAGHIDVSLWYVLKGGKEEVYKYDNSEFNSIRWFHISKLPYGRTDPEMHRFVQKISYELA